ncbi:melanoma-associated antigen B4-like [Ctenodactylus gundi]
MPRGHKSKFRAREKRRQTRDKNLDAQAVVTQEEESPSCSSSVSGDVIPSSSGAELPQESPGDQPATTAAVAASHERSGKGVRSRGKERAESSRAAPAQSSLKQLLMKKAGTLINYLLYKYKVREPIFKWEMLKLIHKSFREYFPEILKLASDRLRLIFALEVKEIKPGSGSYALAFDSSVLNSSNVFSGLDFPLNGFLIPLLGVIFLNGNRASEEEFWEFLNVLGIYKGKKHIIFSDPENIIFEELVQKDYLVYRQVPGSDPPCYEFLWGPRASAEISKMKVLEFWAKFNDTIPTEFPSRYEEALREEEERAQVTAKEGPSAQAKAPAPPPATLPPQ